MAGQGTMSKLLEIFGRAITVNTADLIWHWLNAVKINDTEEAIAQLDDFEEVIDLLGNIELDKAQEKLQFYLFENPECVKGRMAAAAICLHRNDINGAIEQLQSIYMRQPSNTMALYALGYCYERIGHQAQAIEFYQDCMKFKNHLQLPRQRMAAIYFKNGRVDKALCEYEMFTTEHPEDITSIGLLGHLYIVEKQYEKAIDTFNTAIVAHPDNFHDDSHSGKIEQLIAAEQFEEAIEHIQWMMDKMGPLPDIEVQMADVLSRWGRAAEAIAHYENALRIQPNYLEATIKLGTHYLRLQRLSLAAEQFNRAIEINDEIVDAYVGLATAQHLTGQKEQAQSTLSLAAAIQQNSSLLFSETATLQLKVAINEETNQQDGDISSDVLLVDVIKAHQSQMAICPASADVHYKFGILMMIAGRKAEAIKSFENARQINPTHHRALVKLAICLYDSGDGNKAIEKLSTGEILEPASLELHYQTAILYCDKPKFAEALCSLDNTMKENLTQSDVILNIEVVLENLGIVDRAMVTWDRLTEAAHQAISARYQ